MRIIAGIATVVLMASPCWAQERPLPQSETKPVDHGPFTPEANRAYRGGGVILEGVPGGPPPPPADVLALPPDGPKPPR